MATDWFKLAMGFFRDPALIRAGEAAEVAFVRSLGYATENGTKGRIPKAAIGHICPARPAPRFKALVREGLLIEHSDEYEIRSWDKWQEQLDQLQERRRKDRERKRQERAKSADSPDPVHGQSEESPRAVSLSLDGDKESSLQNSEVTPISRSATRRGSRIPDDFTITAEMAQWCRSRGITKDQATASTELFTNYWRAKAGRDATKLDWTLTWQNWLLRDHSSAVAPPRLSAADELAREQGLTR